MSWAELDSNWTSIAEAINLLIPTAASYNALIVFTGNLYMPQQTVAGAVAFTVDETGAVEGAQVTVDLLSDGTNVPSFTGFREWGGSSAWVNLLNVRNSITFFRRNGINWYSINQQVGAAADVIAATAVTMSGPSSGVNGAVSSYFSIGANGSITGTVIVTPSSGAGGGTFTPTTVSISALTPVATFTYTPASTGAKTIAITNNGGLSNPANITYTVSASATAPAQVIGLTLGTATSSTQPLTWTAPSDGGSAITDYVVQSSPAGSGTWTTFADGTSTSATATITGLSASTSYDYRVAAVNAIGQGTYSSTATGSTSASTSYLRLTALAGGMTEYETGPYTYTGADTSYTTLGRGIANLSLPAATDGYVAMAFSSLTGNVFGLRTDSTNGIYSDVALKCALVFGAGITPFTNGASVTANGTTTMNAGDNLRLRRAGSTVYAERSTDGGATWPITVHTWTGITTAQLYVSAGTFSDGVLSNLAYSGLT